MLSVIPDVLATVPFFDTDLYDLRGLLRLGSRSGPDRTDLIEPT